MENLESIKNGEIGSLRRGLGSNLGAISAKNILNDYNKNNN
jgi:hypothetical protein